MASAHSAEVTRRRFLPQGSANGAKPEKRDISGSRRGLATAPTHSPSTKPAAINPRATGAERAGGGADDKGMHNQSRLKGLRLRSFPCASA